MKVSVNHTCFLNVLSHEQPSSLWPVPPISVRVGPWVCSKQFSPARGLFMRLNIVKSDTSILFCWILDARHLHRDLELNMQRLESLQHTPTTWIWTLVYNIQFWDLPNCSESLKTWILLHYCLATAFQTKFQIVRRRKPRVPSKYSTLVRTGDSVKISTKYTWSPREANYIGATLKMVVKCGNVSWNVQVLENWFLPVPLTYIQKLSLLTSHRLLLLIFYFMYLWCNGSISNVGQKWNSSFFHSRKQILKLCQKYIK